MIPRYLHTPAKRMTRLFLNYHVLSGGILYSTIQLFVILGHFAHLIQSGGTQKKVPERERWNFVFFIKITQPPTRWTGLGSAVVNVPHIEDPDIEG